MNACTPPASATTSAPGRSDRWYVFASTTWASRSRSCPTVTPLTDALVPTGMNMGVPNVPCTVS